MSAHPSIVSAAIDAPVLEQEMRALKPAMKKPPDPASHNGQEEPHSWPRSELNLISSEFQHNNK